MRARAYHHNGIPLFGYPLISDGSMNLMLEPDLLLFQAFKFLELATFEAQIKASPCTRRSSH